MQGAASLHQLWLRTPLRGWPDILMASYHDTIAGAQRDKHSGADIALPEP